MLLVKQLRVFPTLPQRRDKQSRVLYTKLSGTQCVHTTGRVCAMLLHLPTTLAESSAPRARLCIQPRSGGGKTETGHMWHHRERTRLEEPSAALGRRWTLTGSPAYRTQAGGLNVKITSDSLRLHGLYVPRNSPGQNTGVGSLSLLQGMLPTQGSNPGLRHCRWILHQLSHKSNPRIQEWVAYPFSRGCSQPRDQTQVSCIVGGFFTSWAMREGGLGWASSVRLASGFRAAVIASAGWALPESVLWGAGGTGRTEPRSSPELACKPVLWGVNSAYRKGHLFLLILWKATCAASPWQHPNPWAAKDRSWRLFQAPTKAPLSPAAALPAHYREHTDSRHPAIPPWLHIPQQQQLQSNPAPVRAPHHTCVSHPVAVLLVRRSLHAQMQGIRQGANHSLPSCLPSTPQEEPQLLWVSALVTSLKVTLASDSWAHTGAHLQRADANYRDLVQKLWRWLGGKVGSWSWGLNGTDSISVSSLDHTARRHQNSIKSGFV